MITLSRSSIADRGRKCTRRVCWPRVVAGDCEIWQSTSHGGVILVQWQPDQLSRSSSRQELPHRNRTGECSAVLLDCWLWEGRCEHTIAVQACNSRISTVEPQGR